MQKRVGQTPILFLSLLTAFASLGGYKKRGHRAYSFPLGVGKRTEEGLFDMKEFARGFYSSKAWQHTREAYKRSVGGLCEECLSRGIVSAGEIVHHKTPITPKNIKDPNITLSFNNLRLLCRECHAKEHDKRKRRYKVDEMGHVHV